MLPRSMRLSRAHFAPSGPEKRTVSPHFSVSVRPLEGQGGVAAVISKKIARLSVTRHRMKRQILAVVRPWCSPDAAIIVYARPGSSVLPFPLLKEELEHLFVRALGAIR